jgi:hypothetical protein
MKLKICLSIVLQMHLEVVLIIVEVHCLLVWAGGDTCAEDYAAE